MLMLSAIRHFVRITLFIETTPPGTSTEHVFRSWKANFGQQQPKSGMTSWSGMNSWSGIQYNAKHRGDAHVSRSITRGMQCIVGRAWASANAPYNSLKLRELYGALADLPTWVTCKPGDFQLNRRKSLEILPKLTGGYTFFRTVLR